jgi:hypothetical protein
VRGISKLKSFLKRLRSYLPSALPKGSEEFEAFSSSIISTFGIPDLPSYRHAIATMIMHLDPTVSRKPKVYFARSIQKAMANEVAYQKIQHYKKIAAEEQAQREKEATQNASNESQAVG